jgi:hypothetical protein
VTLTLRWGLARARLELEMERRFVVGLEGGGWNTLDVFAEDFRARVEIERSRPHDGAQQDVSKAGTRPAPEQRKDVT